VKYAFMARHARLWPLAWQCAALGVSRSGYYEWRTRDESARAKHTREIVAAIRASFVMSDRTYGSPRIWRELRAQGLHVGERRVARLMRKNQLVARARRRRWPKDAGDRPAHALAPNVLDRQFAAPGPNQRWAADFTYLWTDEGWLYVAVVLDLYSRYVVGWSMSPSMTSQLVIDALIMALWRRGKPQGVLHHSDQGSQYTSEDFQRQLAEHGIGCSMSRRGNCWDNAATESFFSTLKTERTDRRHYRSRDEARSDVFNYIEQFYNPHRRHSTLGYLSPAQYERANGH
jgi:putative transposase